MFHSRIDRWEFLCIVFCTLKWIKKILVPPWCFLRCSTRKQQKLLGVSPVLCGVVYFILSISSDSMKMFHSRIDCREFLCIVFCTLKWIKKILVPPWCFFRCSARKQQKLLGVSPILCGVVYFILSVSSVPMKIFHSRIDCREFFCIVFCH